MRNDFATQGEDRPYDFVGVGFGPSNLALAIAADELDNPSRFLFLERNPGVRWHPGMLIDGARMQISFLKDLVSLRNLGSPYTFLRYTEAKGRLAEFVNLQEFRPTRLEYQDYLEWVAGSFADRVRYDTQVTRVTPVRRPGEDTYDLFRVDTENIHTGQRCRVLAANVVYAAGGRPWLPAECAESSTVIHSSRFLPTFPEQFADHAGEHEFGVVGGGQSAGEIVAYLLGHYPNARVHVFLTGWSFRATDNNPFVNEQYGEANADAFFELDKADRAALRNSLANTNYGVVEDGFLNDLYRFTYADSVRDRRRLVIHRNTRVTAVGPDGVTVAPRKTVRCDGVVLATGYDWSLDPEVLVDVLPLLATDADGEVAVSKSARAETKPELRAGLYLQGYVEHSFGLGDTLLSLLPFRSARIVKDIRDRTTPTYPPAHYVESDEDKIYAVMERFNFATLISVREKGDAVVTHLPLTLDRSRCEKGVLFGHLDRNNPHMRMIDDQQLTVLFHGPNAYISPHVFDINLLPTWNSMNVHVRGRGRLIRDQRELRRKLAGICEQSDPMPGAYRLDPADPRIDQLIGGIVGFEIEIQKLVGRFKLSQELAAPHRARAVQAVIGATERGECELIEDVVQLGLNNGKRHNGTPTRQRN